MNKYGIKMTSQFRRDLKLAKKRGCVSLYTERED